MPDKKAPRRKPKRYADAMYGARLPFAEARLVDDYAAAHRLSRADVVRLGLHQFALRQQMHGNTKNSLLTSSAQVLEEQLRPLQARLDELAGLLHTPAPAPSPAAPGAAAVLAELRHTQQLLEQLLVTAMLTLRLQVNYTVAPVLAALPQHDAAALAPHLALAEKGREQWSAATRAVFQRTGQRILQELEQARAAAPPTPATPRR